MATTARQQYFADETSLQKDSREFSIADDIQNKIDSVETWAQVNVIETVKVNWTALTPDVNKAVNIDVPDVIDNLYTVDSNDALSAKQWKLLYDYIQNLQSVGKFLSNWNSATGLPATNPSTSPYTYSTWDYYIIWNVATSPATNYRPSWSSYTIWTASTTVETDTVNIWDIYFYDGTNWLLLINTARTIAVDSSLSTTSTNPVENRVVTNAVNWKADIEYVTQAEYTALLPWAASDGKHYFIYTPSVIPPWTPWANTIVYYPFSTDFSDQSWNWYDLTWYNSATIGTLNWLSCLDLTAIQSYLWTTVSWIPQWWQARTEMFWVKWSALWNYPTHQYGTASFNKWSTIWINNNNPNWILWSNYWYNVLWTWPISVSVWHHVAVVINGSWSAGQVMYVDGVAWPNASLTINTQGTTLYIGKNRDNNYLNWYMSNFIIEDKARTAQEVLDYYNQTKWDYWIS